MARSTWYLLAYDVTEPRRLKRLHYRLSKHRQAMPQQKSVFLVEGDRQTVDAVLNMVGKIIHDREDDVRAYPVQHPSQLWLHGQTNIRGATVQTGQRDKPARKSPGGERRGVVGSLLSRLMGGGDER